MRSLIDYEKEGEGFLGKKSLKFLIPEKLFKKVFLSVQSKIF